MRDTFYFSCFLYLFWFYAIGAINLYRGYLTGKLTPRMPVFWMAVPALLVFVLLDWVMNFTVFRVLCLQAPQSWNELVTMRMYRYRSEGGSGWQVSVANFVCGLLNIFNYDNSNHC